MNTDAPDTPEPTQPAAAEPEATEADQRVPLDRFRSVTSENKELREKLDQLAAWKEEQEAAQLTELERERAAREKAEANAAEASDRATTLERSAWIRNAAQAAGFADPDDAVALIGTAAAEDAETVAKLVTELADKKPHLISAAQAGPATIGSPLAAAAATPVDPADPRSGLGSDILGFLNKR